MVSNLPPTKEEVYVIARAPAFLCLSVCVQDYSKTRAWIWIKCCVSTDAWTLTNRLTFEPDPDYSPDCFLRYHMRCNAEFYYVGKIPRIGIGGVPLERAVVLKWFYSLSRQKTFVGGKCALPSALLVY